MGDYIYISSDNDKAALRGDVFNNIAQIIINNLEDVFLAKKTTEAITCKINNDSIDLNLIIKLRLGCNVNSVCSLLQKKVYDDIYVMTGLKCQNIHLDIVGFVAE